MLVISTLVIVNVLKCCFKYAGLLFTRYRINTNICSVTHPYFFSFAVLCWCPDLMNNLFSYAHMKVSVYLCIYVGFVNMHLLEVSTKHAFVCLLVYMQRVSCMREETAHLT